MIKNKSYQSFDPVSSSVTSKVKGLGYIKNSSSNNLIFESGVKKFRIFDVSKTKVKLLFF